MNTPHRNSLVLALSGWLVAVVVVGSCLLWPRESVAPRQLSGAVPTGMVSVPETGLPVTLDIPVAGKNLRRLELPLQGSAGAAHLEHADILLDGGCHLVNSKPLTLLPGRLVFLVPEGNSCMGLKPSRAVEGRLSVRSDAPVALPASPGGTKGLILHTAEGLMSSGGTWASGAGRTTRLNMLAVMWHFSPWLLLGLLSGAGVLGGLGLLLLFRPSRAAGSIVAVGLLALALGMSYAVLSPPFHAPDEHSHFYAFCKVNASPELLDSGRELGWRGHFPRLKGNRVRFMTPLEARGPMPPRDFMADSHRVEGRSALTTLYWHVLGKLLPLAQANVVLLGVRLANSLLFGLAAALAALLLHRACPEDAGAPVFMFVLPALPFFAMHLSNHAVAASLCCVAAATAYGLFRRRGNWPLAGVLLGLVVSLASLTTRSLVGLSLGCLVLVAGVPVFAAGRPRREALAFWMGLALGLIPLLLFWGHPQVMDLVAVGQGVLRIALPRPVAFLAAAATPLAIFPAALMGYALERLFARFRCPGLASVLRWGLLGLAGLLGVFLLLGTMTHGPSFPDIERGPFVDLLSYLKASLWGMLWSLTPRTPDYFLQASLWGGFAWLETLLPAVLVRALSGALGLGLVFWLYETWRARDNRAAGMAWVYLLAVAVAILGTTFGAWSTKMNLHGRYLLGCYLLLLAPAAATWAGMVRRWRPWLSGLGLAGICCLHALGPLLLLERFFGCETLYSLLGFRFG